MASQKNLVRTVSVATCLIGAVLMTFGEPIMGLEHTGIATVAVITGIFLVNSCNKTAIFGKEEDM